MEIKITSATAEIIVATDELRGMKYAEEDYYRDGQDGLEYIAEEGNPDGSRSIYATCESSPWQSYTWRIGGHYLCIEDTVDGANVYIDWESVEGIVDATTGEDYKADILGVLYSAGVPFPTWESVKHDYDAMAKAYYDDAEHTGYRYYIDEERGFANEWTLHIVTDPSIELEDGIREVTDRDEIIHLIADAAMSGEDYTQEHLASDGVGCIIH